LQSPQISTQNIVEKKDIFLFYQDNNPLPLHSMGALFWCSPGTRVAADTHCLPLKSILEVFIGKHTDVFESDVAKSVDATRCVSFISEQERLDFEAASTSIVQLWLAAINRIKKRGGNKIKRDNANIKDSKSSANMETRKTTSFIPPEQPASLTIFDRTERARMEEVKR